ncbi:tetratricopeptide repeat protein [Fulvivirgaceae bacterium BMA12]|uniref:Tetratricopeptide repeat protein n=1 Tax=Agaribacillus aureus TaxID=3051825 RepID=A0ABT8L4H9_9BACT|nr:tetratricopeptide repeat protein [Fulvivirgaceae bacterium BMA12]
MDRSNHHLFIILLGFGFFFAGCSAEKNNAISKAYHSTTARFNPYFIANEHIKEVEATLEEQHDNNYNKVLKIYPSIDSTTIEGLKPQLEDALKKCSKAIDWHKNSNMVEPSYILLGRSLYYLGEFEKSVMAYKIVNKNITSENKNKNKSNKSQDVRHEALIHLIRTYTDYNEDNNAIAVADFLRKERLSKQNKKRLFLNKAYLYQKRDEMDSMVNNLVKAAPLMKKSEGKAKIYFIIGQIYQSLGFDAEAHSNYTKCIKYNPDYELFFYARLNRAQVFELSKTTDLKKIRKFYQKLLKDAKNEEFKDKIYYDMAEFEMKQDNLDQAIEHYKSSVASSVNNNRQKGYSYWRLGQINYERLKNFELAKLYYDSTVQVMPKDEESYEAIAERQQVLEDFVKQLNTIHLQDSLLTLANMDSMSLSAYLDEVIKKEEALLAEQKLEEEKRNKRNARSFGSDFGEKNNAFTSGRVEDGDKTSSWYFYNNSARAQGQNEFRRRWGTRPLEDDWRRANKESVLAETQAPVGQADAEGAEQKQEEVDPAVARSERKKTLYSSIPFSEQAKAEANQMLEDAFYNLGNIYNFNLLEKSNALNTFDTLLVRYPTSKYKPEVLYQMYLINKNMEGGLYEQYKTRILEEFPNSIYAKILINPNYQEESKIASEKLKKVYKEAYAHFTNGDYETATQIINRGKEGFEENDFSDNVRLLEILILGKTDDVYRYQSALTEFPKNYPESEMKAYAAELLSSSQNLLNEVKSAKAVKFIQDFDQNHSFVLVYNFETYGENELPTRIENFINNHFPDKGLNFAQLILTGSKSLIVVNQFETRDDALTFFNLFNGENTPLKGLNTLDFSNFVITKDNFDIFYQTKDIDNYLSFFEQHYN